MPEPITFRGQLWRISQDHEGESKVTFAIPLSDLERVLRLGEMTQMLLNIQVKVSP